MGAVWVIGTPRSLLTWLAEHLTEDLTVPKLARQANMSERHFSRMFKVKVGMTPAGQHRHFDQTAIPTIEVTAALKA